MSRRVVAAKRRILPLLGFRGLPKIGRAVVAAIKVKVIDSARTPFAVNHQPNQQMFAPNTAVQMDNPIPARFVQATRLRPGLCARRQGNAPPQNPRFGVKAEHLV